MLLKMSLTGGTLILFIIAVRFFALDKLPKRIFMLLWLVALLRLLAPVELPLAYGIASPVINAVGNSLPGENVDVDGDGFGKVVQKITLPNYTDFETETAGRKSFRLMGSEVKVPDVLSASLKDAAVSYVLGDVFSDNFSFLSVIWMTGALAMFFCSGILYIREQRKIREALPVSEEREGNLRLLACIPGAVKLMVSDRIMSPLTFGIFRPKIILPRALWPENDRQMKYVLIHELVHIKRADNLWKIAMLFALCIHWFNPLVWLMYVLFNRDMELSCDEKVLLLMGEGAKKEYAMTLVNLAEKQCRLSAFSIGFGKNAVKERIMAIMKFKKITVLGMVCAVALTGVSVTAFAAGKGSAGGKNENFAVRNTAVENGSISIKQTVANSDVFPEYEKYGLSYDAETDHLMYEGAIVGFFHDETSPGVYIHLTDEDGNIYLVVNRDSSNVIVSIKPVEAIPTGDILEGTEQTAERLNAAELSADEDESAFLYENDLKGNGSADDTAVKHADYQWKTGELEEADKSMEEEYAAYLVVLEDEEGISEVSEKEFWEAVKAVKGD